MAQKQKTLNAPQKIHVRLRNLASQHKILTVFIVIIAIPTILFAINFLDDQLRTFNAYSQVQTARQDKLTKSDNTFDEQKKLISGLGEGTTSVALSKKDICFVAHNDSGWFATDYYQECYIRYVQLFNTDLTKDEIIQKLQSNTQREELSAKTLVNSLFGEVERRSYATEKFAQCTVYEQGYSPSVVYIPAGFDASRYEYTQDCEAPSETDVPGPAYVMSNLSVKTYSDIDPTLVDSSKNQLWIMYTTKYYKEALGCGAGLLFCENPRATPAHPDI